MDLRDHHLDLVQTKFHPATRDVPRTVTSASCASCSATRRCHTRRAVWRCLRGASTSASNQASITATHGSIAAAAAGPDRSSAPAGPGHQVPDAPCAGAPCAAPRVPGSTGPPVAAPAESPRTAPPVTAPLPGPPRRRRREDPNQGGANIRDDTQHTHQATRSRHRWGQHSRRQPGPDQAITPILPEKPKVGGSTLAPAHHVTCMNVIARGTLIDSNRRGPDRPLFAETVNGCRPRWGHTRAIAPSGQARAQRSPDPCARD